MVSAALYLRASSDYQKYSTANQRDALTRYAADHQLEVAAVYEDDGRSGLTLEGRDALRQLLKDVLSGAPPFEVLLVYDVSRWGRFQDADESAHYEFLCRRAGVRVVYCAEAFENDGSSMANLLKAMKRVMAGEYSRDLSIKVAAGKRRLASLGFAQSNGGYGYRRGLIDQDGTFKCVLRPGERKSVQTDRIILVPGPAEEVATVQLIFRLFLKSRLRFFEIADQLNRRKTPSPAGGQWTSHAVQRVLRSERYIGNLVYGRTSRTLKGRTLKKLPETWTRVEGVYVGIIERSTFAATQRRMKEISERRLCGEDFLPRLKALFEREGYLTPALINAQKDMPNAQAYMWRYGGLINAYRAVGYISPRDASEDWDYVRADEAAREALLAQLKALLDREGYLTTRLINSEPGMPSFRVYQWAFGSLYAAYELIDYWPQRAGRFKPRSRIVAEQLDEAPTTIGLPTTNAQTKLDCKLSEYYRKSSRR